MELLWNVVAVAGLVFGFGFVVFFHELGHFLAAKWTGIRVEQFAVGFGHAIGAWRKGIGFRVGTTTPEYEKRIKAHLEGKQVGASTNEPTPPQVDRAAEELGLGETEYRLNWIPLGGYVKMMGQDDLDPNAQVEDPRAYNKKSIGARMFVVSAGVIMNVILAGILFMALFLMGFNAPPAAVGSVQTNSPAQLAGWEAGDRLLTLNGQRQHDFSKLMLTTALAPGESPIPYTIQKRDGRVESGQIQPRRLSQDPRAFLTLGVGPTFELQGLPAKDRERLETNMAEMGLKLDPAAHILPGDVVLQINGEDVAVADYAKLDEAVQASGGRPVDLTVRGHDGATRTVRVRPRFESFFGETPINVAGMEPLMRVESVMSESAAKGKLQSGDRIVELKVAGGEAKAFPSFMTFLETVYEAGDKGQTVSITVDREGARETYENLSANLKLGGGKRGLGIGPGIAEEIPVVSKVLEGSAAARAGIAPGTRIVAVDGKPVASWFDVHRLLASGEATAAERTVALTVQKDGEAETAEVALALNAEELKQLERMRYRHDLVQPGRYSLLRERMELRRTSNPLVAAQWGVTETRDLLLQFYVTLQRVFQGSVSAKNFMGPIGIVHTGSIIAFRGWDWLIWFLAMISANLAVVNFLPIPIVDGGLFLFLIVEKIKGKPLSPRMQTVAQLVGLAIILSVFILVTYQDIARIFL